MFIPEDDIVYNISDNDQRNREIAETFKEDIDESNDEEIDDNTEVTIVSAVVHWKALKCILIFVTAEDTCENIRLLKDLLVEKSNQMKKNKPNQYFN